MNSPSDRPIVHAASAWDIGGEIVHALGLKDVAEFSLVFKGGEPVQCVAVHYVRAPAGEKIAQLFTTSRYQLVSAPGEGSDLDRRATAGEG